MSPEISDLLHESWQREVDVDVEIEVPANIGLSTVHNNQYLNELFSSGGIKIHHLQKIYNIISKNENEAFSYFHFKVIF